jgi:hypothetical protein
MQLNTDEVDPDHSIWKDKVARYLAYCVDGGLL